MLKALVRVTLREVGGRGNPVKAKGYRPHLVVNGGNGEFIGVQFTDDITLELGKPEVSEVAFIYDKDDEMTMLMGDGVDCSEFVKDAQFVVMEGSKIVADGIVLATNRKEKDK